MHGMGNTAPAAWISEATRPTVLTERLCSIFEISTSGGILEAGGLKTLIFLRCVHLASVEVSFSFVVSRHSILTFGLLRRRARHLISILGKMDGLDWGLL